MTATRTARVLVALLAGVCGQVVHAGSVLQVVLSVTYSSGPCGAAVTEQGVNVFCGPIPVLAPVTGGAGRNSQSLLPTGFTNAAPPFLGFSGANGALPSGPFSPEISGVGPDEATSGPALPEVEPPMRRVGTLPASVTGHAPLAVYSGGANVSSWRVVSIDNAEHVELTISW